MSAPTICTAFAAQVAAHADLPAVLGDGEILSYRELGSAVAATAQAIRDAAGAGGGRAALLCQHGSNTVIALLAALGSGRAYVPLDPTFPLRRLVHTLADSGADVLLIDELQAGFADGLIAAADRMDLALVHIRRGSGSESLEEVLAGLESPAAPDDPAYLLYTSGSTGVPKGVVHSHANVLFGIGNHVRNFGITVADRMSVLTSFGYDMAVTDMFSAILSGAAAVPVDIRTHGLGRLAETLAHHGVTVYHSTPTVYRFLLASLGPAGRLPQIRAVLLGGEEVTRHDVELCRRHFAPEAVFVNGYGTTEISFAAQYHIHPDEPLEHTVVPIGRPLAGIEVLLVDDSGEPSGDTGEIVVRCDRVALGYWRLPELTASRFVDLDGVRAYRTGDLARRLPDGRLVYLGRADRMVKVRGYRVELGEVESQLAALPGVGHAAVVARDSLGAAGPQVKEIVAYAVPARDAALEPAAVRAALALSLPDFMLPRWVSIVDSLPIGVTGKLDVQALPEPDPAPIAAHDLDPLQQAIASIWCEVLGVDRVDRHTNFFELGGHSLLMALVQQRLEGMLGHRVAQVQLFEHTTVASLAEHLRAASPGATGLMRTADRMRQRREARRAAEPWERGRQMDAPAPAGQREPVRPAS